MRRVGVGAEKPDKKSTATDAKLKKEIKDLEALNEKLQVENAALKEENEQLQPKK